MAECARDAGRWLGHRLFIADGSSFSLPDTDELRQHFGQPGGKWVSTWVGTIEIKSF